MAVTKVDLYVSQILEDLNNGLTWLKRDELGYGSIQDKYGAKDQQIAMIRKHPALKDAETNVIVFNVIDDSKDERKSTTVPALRRQVDQSMDSIFEPVKELSGSAIDVPVISKNDDGGSHKTDPTNGTDELAAFVNL